MRVMSSYFPIQVAGKEMSDRSGARGESGRLAWRASRSSLHYVEQCGRSMNRTVRVSWVQEYVLEKSYIQCPAPSMYGQQGMMNSGVKMENTVWSQNRMMVFRSLINTSGIERECLGWSIRNTTFRLHVSISSIGNLRESPSRTFPGYRKGSPNTQYFAEYGFV